jgi:hypothetical protein
MKVPVAVVSAIPGNRVMESVHRTKLVQDVVTVTSGGDDQLAASTRGLACLPFTVLIDPTPPPPKPLLDLHEQAQPKAQFSYVNGAHSILHADSCGGRERYARGPAYGESSAR